MAYTPDYAPSDMPSVATDVLGEAGVQFKVWIPLYILGFVLVILAGAWLAIKKAGRR